MEIDTRRRTALGVLQAWDVAIFAVSLLLALHNRDTSALEGLAQTPFRTAFWLCAAGLAWRLSLSAAQVYRSQRLSRTMQTTEILFGTSLGTTVAGALAVLMGVDAISNSVLLYTWGFSAAVIVLSRVALRRVLHALRKRGRNLRVAMVIGSGERALKLLKKLDEVDSGYQWLGYVDEREEPHLARQHGLRYLGTLHGVPAVLAAHVVDEVFVTLPLRSRYDLISHTILDCENQGISVKMPLDLFDSCTSPQHIDSLGGAPVLCYAPAAASTHYLFTKRVIDLLISVFGLVALAPLLLLVSVLIKLDSRGPVFFVQHRVGLHKRLFPLIKFRTMRVGSEDQLAELAHLNEADGPVFKIKNDPRVTPLGRILRRTSIDELPQLINVLLGHLSLVGPRPLPVRDVQGFSVDAQRRRFSVQPGITCTWQISGRSTLSFERWMELDMLYIKQRSLALDLKIIARTIPAVLNQRGAS
jgi:exopolysaccharide biosynthesis polyprenyl glycosylphosphotransferase